MSSDRGYRATRVRWGSSDFVLKALVVVVLTALFLVAYTSPSHAQSLPVAAYSFDEGSGTTVSDSARNHNGTISGATWAAVGKYGSALDFDGVDDLVSIADAADLDLTSAFTLEAWVRPDTLTAGRPVIAKSESAGGNSGYLLSARYAANNTTGFVASSGAFKSVSRPSPLPEAVWSHLAFTSDGTNLRLYVDGKLEATAPAIAAKATAANLVIGQGQVLGGYFDGMIDEVRIYADTLSESVIQTDRDTAVGLDQIPVAAYSFDEGAGTTLSDSIDNHDGAISGATWTTGKHGSALNFDGVDDLVSIADAADLDLTSTFTLEAWVNPTSLANPSPIVSKGETSGGNSGYLLSAKYGANAAGYVANSGTAAEIGGAALSTNTWSHLTFTSDGTNLRLYIDGVSVSPKSAIVAKASSAKLEIGHSFLGGYFGGRIDEVRIYNEALSEGQIQVDRDSRVQRPPATEVTTSVLDTGPSSELVSSVPITTTGIETVVYSLPITSLKASELLRVTGNLEVTNQQTYNVTDSVRLILGSTASDSSGTAVTPWTQMKHTPEMIHWTLPLNGIYHASADFGSTQYLKIILKASSSSAKSGDTLIVQPNFGRLAVTRLTPAPGSMSQPTHKLQPHRNSLPELISSIPVNSSWQRVMTRKISPLSYNDILDIVSQIEVQSTSNATVQLESKITQTTAPSTGGSTASPLVVERLTPSMPSARILHSNQLLVSDPARAYLNLLVRAVPISGTPSPLNVTAGTASLSVLQHDASLGISTAELGQGTLVEERTDFSPNVASIPFALGSAPEPRVVASTLLPGGVWKGETIRARGLVTGNLAGGEKAQLLTTIVLADSPTETTGEVIGVFSGDRIPTDAQVHTVVKEGLYVVPKALGVSKYVNLVARASRLPAYSGEAMSVLAGSVYVSRLKPTFALDEGFEQGLDALFESTSHGSVSASTDHAREGNKSLLTNLDFSKNIPESNSFNLHNEVKPPDKRTSGGYEGEDSWYGFSAYFPEKDFTLGPDSGHFDGLIDEVRLYDQTLSQTQIVDDRDGKYAETPNPVAAYGFNEGSGILASDSVGSNDGVIEGATWALGGKNGSALSFDGIDDQLVVPDAEELDFTETFTLEAWVRPDQVGVWDPIVTKVESESNIGYRMLSAGGGAFLKAEYGAPTGIAGTEPSASTSIADGGPLLANTWSHLALTSDGVDLRLYIDGEQAATVSAAGAASTESDLTIGASDVPGGGAAVLDTIFMQWHGVNGGLDCEMPSGNPPIAFHVRRFTANQWTNAGDTKTATPVTGDYIYVTFAGGELDANCTAVQPFPFTYVLAPLERERWYDFVLHTKWTTETGSPEKSVSEVWLDGKQLLGDDSYAVTRPNLYWHGTQAVRDPMTNMQLGIYRHVSGSQPTSRLYIDAVRRGNSYGEVVPGQ